jgi:hypothetical protein
MSDLTLAEMARGAGEHCEIKGFRQDWHNADELERLADAIADGSIDELPNRRKNIETLRRIAEQHRMLVLMTKLGLIASEAAEAMAVLRAEGLEALRNTEWASELADIHIRTGELEDITGVPAGANVEAKMEKNATRPYMHGKKF